MESCVENRHLWQLRHLPGHHLDPGEVRGIVEGSQRYQPAYRLDDLIVDPRRLDEAFASMHDPVPCGVQTFERCESTPFHQIPFRRLQRFPVILHATLFTDPLHQTFRDLPSPVEKLVLQRGTSGV